MRGCGLLMWGALSLGVFLLLGAAPAKSSVEGEEIHYEVTTLGFQIGDVQVAQKSGGHANAPEIYYENKTDVRASFLWLHYRHSQFERAVLHGENLIRYSRQGINDDASVSVEGKLLAGAFHLQVTEKGTHRTLLIPRNDYDHTSLECPEAFIDFDAGGRATLRLLDMEYLEIVTRHYQLVRKDVYRLGDKEYPCRVVDISDIHKSCRRWIGRVGDTVIMFRQDGNSDQGSYSVRAVSLSRPLSCRQHEWLCRTAGGRW